MQSSVPGLNKQTNKQTNKFYVTKTKECRGKKKSALSSSLRTPDPFSYSGTLGFLPTCLGTDSLQTLMLGKIEGTRRRGRQRRRWLDGITDSVAWIWANSGRKGRTGEPGTLQSMGSQRVRHELATEQREQVSGSNVATAAVYNWPDHCPAASPLQ